LALKATNCGTSSNSSGAGADYAKVKAVNGELLGCRVNYHPRQCWKNHRDSFLPKGTTSDDFKFVDDFTKSLEIVGEVQASDKGKPNGTTGGSKKKGTLRNTTESTALRNVYAEQGATAARRQFREFKQAHRQGLS
jgi:hypothetical protein